MPPLHPAFVHFPIALITFSFVFDLLARFFNKESLRSAAFWCLIGGLMGGALTAITGYVDYTRDALGDAGKYAELHMDLGLILVACVIALSFWRWRIFTTTNQSSLPYLIAAFLVVGLTLFQGWYGGEMVYSQGAGVAAAGKGTEPADKGKQRLDKFTPMK